MPDSPRVLPPSLSQVVDAVYHANAHVLLQGDTCFRWERLPDGKLTVQLMDADKMDAPSGKAQLWVCLGFVGSSSLWFVCYATPAVEVLWLLTCGLFWPGQF